MVSPKFPEIPEIPHRQAESREAIRRRKHANPVRRFRAERYR